MERKGEEGDISDHSCVLTGKKNSKNSCLEALRAVLLFFPWAGRGTEQCACEDFSIFMRVKFLFLTQHF